MPSNITPGRIFLALAILAALLALFCVGPAALLQLAVRIALLGAGIGVVLALRPTGSKLFD